jgi:hypothetical protein
MSRLLPLILLLFAVPTTLQARPALSDLVHFRTTIPAYERILSQPVFQVTTPWGSPYMLFEKYKDEEKALESAAAATAGEDDVAKFSRVQQKDDMADTRPVSLYFMDEFDARALADEMKQMKHMKDGDLRITCTTLGKAVRQASKLGNGLPTGQPVDQNTGKMLSMDEGGSLRHKIVPSKRELFYAARCLGKERVGCFGDGREEADLMLQPTDVIEGSKMAARRRSAANQRNRVQKARQYEKEGIMESYEERIKREWGHMEGQVGCPVFYAEGLIKKPPLANRWIGGAKAWEKSLTPLYFSYQDLLRDWNAMRNRAGDKSATPEMPEVEVFNMLDVVTSLDKDQWKLERRAELLKERKGLLGKVPIVNNFLVKKGKSGLEGVVFVPSSLGVQAKERISGKGNGKARLRPMRAWGKNA